MNLDLETKYQVLFSLGDTALLSLQEILHPRVSLSGSESNSPGSFGEKTLLYVYPRDNTPGCTLENKDFSCMIADFQKLGITLVGLSQDTIESHKKFQLEHQLRLDLISDPELILHKQLGAYGEKNNYGKIVKGVIRSTFLFNKKGDILQEWKNVKAKGHAAKILKELQK